MRFASVYREFKDVNEFMQELETVKTHASNGSETPVELVREARVRELRTDFRRLDAARSAGLPACLGIRLRVGSQAKRTAGTGASLASRC